MGHYSVPTSIIPNVAVLLGPCGDWGCGHRALSLTFSSLWFLFFTLIFSCPLSRSQDFCHSLGLYDHFLTLTFSVYYGSHLGGAPKLLFLCCGNRRAARHSECVSSWCNQLSYPPWLWWTPLKSKRSFGRSHYWAQ